jgi:hypothetical protein
MGNYWLDQCLEMWTNDTDYVIAYDLNDAMNICASEVGYAWDEMYDWDWHKMDEDKEFSYQDANGNRCTHPVGYFIAAYGRRYFACSEY